MKNLVKYFGNGKIFDYVFDKELVKALIENKTINPNTPFRNGFGQVGNLLEFCMYKPMDNIGTIKYLLYMDSDIHTRCVIIASSESKYLGILNMFLFHGADPNRSNNGTTPLIEAINAENVEAVKSLLRYGANPGLKTKYGTNAIDLAFVSGMTDIYNILINSQKEDIPIPPIHKHSVNDIDSIRTTWCILS